MRRLISGDVDIFKKRRNLQKISLSFLNNMLVLANIFIHKKDQEQTEVTTVRYKCVKNGLLLSVNNLTPNITDLSKARQYKISH